MQRFFVASPLSIDMNIIDPDILHQMIRVMRSEVGDSIVLFDGDGSETTYEIISITKKSLSLRGKDRIFPRVEPLRKIALYQALPSKIEKIEHILQKGVEVGIMKFIFFRSEYSQKLLLSEAKMVRFRAIIREAVEQCGGVSIPELHFISMTDFPSGNVPNMVLDTTGKVMKVSELPVFDQINIWIGPEGGWSDKERKKMNDNGFLFVRLGERVLRTETAGVVSAFALLHA